jgi:hypothetical protein
MRTIVIPDFGEHVTARMTRKMLYLLGQPVQKKHSQAPNACRELKGIDINCDAL